MPFFFLSKSVEGESNVKTRSILLSDSKGAQHKPWFSYGKNQTVPVKCALIKLLQTQEKEYVCPPKQQGDFMGTKRNKDSANSILSTV